MPGYGNALVVHLFVLSYRTVGSPLLNAIFTAATTIRTRSKPDMLWQEQGVGCVVTMVTRFGEGPIGEKSFDASKIIRHIQACNNTTVDTLSHFREKNRTCPEDTYIYKGI
jgi:hypothetical protein